MKIDQATSAKISEFWKKSEPAIERSKAFEKAAQQLVTEIRNQFDESVVLARVFLTVPFERLPPGNQQFVRKLAESAGGAGELKPTTPVLSLVGTSGREPNWNDRRNSKGHVGIPLISSSFVDAIPMISRLLKELGISLEWIDSQDANMIVETIGREAGLFYVDNAAQATDGQGRKIIAAQDFVSAHKVKSVFGIGGAYDNGQMVVIVVFCRDQFPRTAAERFLTLVNLFKSKTEFLLSSEPTFAA